MGCNNTKLKIQYQTCSGEAHMMESFKCMNRLCKDKSTLCHNTDCGYQSLQTE